MSHDSTYCIAYERSLTLLERELYHLRNPEDIIIGVLEAVCSFYEAEWAGVLDADLEIGIWTPIWWYNANTGALQETRLRAFEFTDGFIRWERALKNGDGVILSDIEVIRSDSPDEYGEYIRLGVRNVMGAPYHKRSMGFLVTKNNTGGLDVVEVFLIHQFVRGIGGEFRAAFDIDSHNRGPFAVRNINDGDIIPQKMPRIYRFRGNFIK